MSDVERTKGLMATDDPQVWAEEFVRIFNGAIIGSPEGNVSSGQVYLDEGTMIGWLANAMEAAVRIDKARRARIAAATASIPDAEKEAFVAGFSEGREPEPE